MNFNEKDLADQHAAVKSVSVPVISIGNLTTGGTGKTPMVVWLSRFLRSLDQRVAIVSRGYGMNRNDPQASQNDEAMELEMRLPDVPHLQDPDRHKVATIAVEELESQIIVLDDGFQHRRLHRNLDIVLIDATNPFGFNRLLPRGLLREPISSLNRADVAIVTRCDLVEHEKVEAIRRKIAASAPDLFIATAITRPNHWQQNDGTTAELKHLNQQKVYVCCAIGNPDGFVSTLKKLGAASNDCDSIQVVGQSFFADHHHFSRKELKEIADQAKSLNADAIVCTHKDLVKLAVNQLNGLPVYALIVETCFQSGEKELISQVENVIRLQNFDG